MRPEAATQCIASFEKRFGRPHLYLACHAALPLAATPGLLYSLWANFQRDCHGRSLNIPWVAVANLLLSSLFKEVGYELYEMDDAVRSKLLDRLQEDESLGQKRIIELSHFLSEYVRQQLYSDDPDIQDFARAQRWAALAYIRPIQAASELALALAKAYSENAAEIVRMSSLVEMLAEPLGEFEQLLAYARGMKHFAMGDLDKATDQLSKAIAAGPDISAAGIRLPVPEELRTKLPTPPVVVTLLRQYSWVLAIAIAAVAPAAVYFWASRPVIIQPPQPTENPAANLPVEHPLYKTTTVTSISQLSDVQPSDWFFQPLQSLVERYGIIYPYPDGTFRGNQAITRAEVVDLLANAFSVLYSVRQEAFNSSPLCSYKQPLHSFTLPKDMNTSDWYYKSYATLVWITGNKFTYPDNTFRGNNTANRAEMVVFVNRFLDAIQELIAECMIDESSLNQIFDKNLYSLNLTALAQVKSPVQISEVQPNDWFFNDLQSLVERYGVTAGFPDGTFRANKASTRAEFVANLDAGLGVMQELIRINLNVRLR